MQFIIKFIRLLLTNHQPRVSLGRWNLDYCNKKINRKIDLSNTDHCGPCGLDKIRK